MKYGASFLRQLCTPTECFDPHAERWTVCTEGCGEAPFGEQPPSRKPRRHTGSYWSTVRIAGNGGQVMTLDGISNGAARRMLKAIQTAVVCCRRHLLDMFSAIVRNHQ